MAFSHGVLSEVLVNAKRLTPVLDEWSVQAGADTAEVSTFGDTAKEYIAGLRDGSMQGAGIWDTVEDASWFTFHSGWGGAQNNKVSYYPQGYAEGAEGWGTEAQENNYEPVADVGEAVRFTVAFQGIVGVERIESHAALAARTTTGNGGGLDSGTVSTPDGGVGYIHLTASSAGTVVAKIQDSADNSVWADILTFPTLTSALNDAKRTAISGTVRRYTRAQWTITGASANLTFQIGFGRYV